MEQKDIYELISAFDASSLTDLEICRDSFQLKLKRNPAAGTSAAAGALTGVSFPIDSAAAAPASAASATPTESSHAVPAATPASPTLHQVKSPIVGIFYASPSPEAEPYVTAGQRVEEGQVLCLIEAMKMMNEMKAPVSGILRTACGVNGEMVEFDQLLFEVEPC